MWKLLMTRKIHAHIHTQRMASHIQRRNWRDGKSEWQASSNGEFWAKVQKFLDNQLFFFLSSSSPNYLLISSSIEYQLLCHGRPRRRSVSVWWDTARAKNGSSKNQFGIEYSMKLFRRSFKRHEILGVVWIVSWRFNGQRQQIQPIFNRVRTDDAEFISVSL